MIRWSSFNNSNIEQLIGEFVQADFTGAKSPCQELKLVGVHPKARSLQITGIAANYFRRLRITFFSMEALMGIPPARRKKNPQRTATDWERCK